MIFQELGPDVLYSLTLSHAHLLALTYLHTHNYAYVHSASSHFLEPGRQCLASSVLRA